MVHDASLMHVQGYVVRRVGHSDEVNVVQLLNECLVNDLLGNVPRSVARESNISAALPQRDCKNLNICNT